MYYYYISIKQNHFFCKKKKKNQTSVGHSWEKKLVLFLVFDS